VHQVGRKTKTGDPEWCTTFSVTLPRIHRVTPDLPCVHMAIKLPWVRPAKSMIDSAAGPVMAMGRTWPTPWRCKACTVFSK
jgi:hypothetical protein